MGLEHLLFSLNNWTVFCPTAAEYNDKELLDSLKITFFYRMMNKVKKLGVVLEPEVEPKSIEKWPIIQSYALEPVGKTFFTLKHETVNISQKILPLFKNLDKHSLMNLVSGAAYAMEGHIKGTTQLIEYTKSEERSAISESKLQECLQEAVDSPIEGQVACKASRVLYGVKTNNSKNVVSSSECTIANAKAFHMTIEHTDPSTLLQVWRTYFLNPSIKHQRVTLTIQEESG